MPSRPRGLAQRLRDQLMFSVIAIILLTIALRFLGLRSSVSSIFLSIILTLLLNVGLSYWADRRPARRRPVPRGGGDIRWRDEDPR